MYVLLTILSWCLIIVPRKVSATQQDRASFKPSLQRTAQAQKTVSHVLGNRYNYLPSL